MSNNAFVFKIMDNKEGRILSDEYQDELPLMQPEKRFLYNYLLRAVNDYKRQQLMFNNSKCADNQKEQYYCVKVKYWFRSNSTTPFSFLWTCDMLNLDENKVLEILKRPIDKVVDIE